MQDTSLKIVKAIKTEHLEFIKTQAKKLVPYVTWNYENFLQLFDKDTHLTLLLEKNNKPVSFCSFILAYPTADVDLTATKSEFQNFGYASLLFTYAIKLLKQKGYESVFLEVAESNMPAQNFYKKLGFEKQNRVIENYYNNGQNALTFKLDL